MLVAFVLCNHTGRLFQKYIVDAWCKVEEYKLSWFKINQKSIRADLYKVCTHQPKCANLIAVMLYIEQCLSIHLKLNPISLVYTGTLYLHLEMIFKHSIVDNTDVNIV